MDAYAKSKTPESARDRRATPRWLFKQIEQMVGVPIVHDVCAEPETAKCASFWTAEDDCLMVSWKAFANIKLSGRYNAIAFWMNPPYSNPEPFLAKAVEESAKGLIVVGLLPDDRGARWYQRHIEGVANTLLIPDGRISFHGPDGKPQNGNPKPSVIPIWTPWRTGKTMEYRFKRDRSLA